MIDSIHKILIEVEKALCAAQYVDNREIRQMAFDEARQGIVSALAQLDKQAKKYS